MIVRILVSCLVLAFVAACKEAELPDRRDCITKVVSQSDELNFQNSQKIGGLFQNHGHVAEVRNIAGTATPRPNVLFIQFKDGCESRAETAKSIMLLLFQEDQFSVSDAVVVPSPDTIDLRGEYWAN